MVGRQIRGMAKNMETAMDWGLGFKVVIRQV